ncbi:hypothetical protein QLQ15_09900 [Lysobacter sp. LF1]|uniref:DUF5117 domain-containing protein n=1 Tax=Lysobacter stagni TaxID=3045172 RepID=A0ABT6XGY5_9GAMM|nr:hypothetical protein [Lysobacter sp. LF1]MDI9239223.1 hypothetical protein [Lysobacter sp. LF1]
MHPLRLLALPLLLSWSLSALAADPKPLPPERIQINQLTNETQQTSSSRETVDLVWWLPSQFWLASARNDDRSAMTQIAGLFDQYTVVAAVNGKIGTLGIDKFMDENELREAIRLRGADGKEYTPIDPGKLDPKVTMVFGVLKPVLGSMIGQLGNNLHFFVFPAKGKDGKPLADPLAPGKVSVQLGQARYDFTTPLGSLLTPQRDPRTGQTFPGSYRFNPYTGSQLEPLSE